MVKNKLLYSFKHIVKREFDFKNVITKYDEHNNKKNADDDIIMNDYDLPTFQETYDPLNYHLDDMLDLKRI